MGLIPHPDSTLVSSYEIAKYFTLAKRTSLDWIVLHSAEMKDTSNAAEALGSWLHGPSAAHVSAHYSVDLDSIVQMVPEASIAWAAGHTGNQRGIHLEIAGYAKETAEQWKADGALELVSKLVADIAERWSIQLEFVDAAGLVAGKKGVTTHAEISKAFHESDHVDPGGLSVEDVIAGAMLARADTRDTDRCPPPEAA